MNELKEILLAEDDPNDVELTLNALEDYNLSNSVQVVHNGEEAIDYLHRHGAFSTIPSGNPALILLDLKMPKVDGLEVLRHIKSDADLQNIPTVMLTSSREEKDIIESYKLGVNAYVVKPVDFQQFIDAVKKLGLFWALYNEPPPGSIRKYR
ncbi:MAG: response regulator [Chitinispirillaceae bacterium]|nr:response regulator [Chitinispirillaceae bacterium]